MERLKVAIFSGSSITYFGGGERYAIDFGNELTKKNLDVTLFTHINNKKANISLEKIKELSNFKFFIFQVVPFMQSPIIPIIDHKFLLALRGVKTIYTIDESIFTMIFLIAYSKFYKVKLVYGMHIPKSFMFGFESGINERKRWLWHFYKLFLIGIFKAFVSNIHVLNKQQITDLNSIGYKGKIYEIPNFINTEMTQIKINTKKFNVLFSGQINSNIKGVDLLCEIIKLTLSIENDIYFHITGHAGDSLQIVDNLVEQFHNNVIFHGFVSDSKLELLFGDASLFVLTSRYESFSLSVLKAQAYGIPVIAYNINGPNEIILNNFQGELISPFDTSSFSKWIVKYFFIWRDNKEYFQNIRESIQINAYEKFSKEKTMKKLTSLIIDK